MYQILKNNSVQYIFSFLVIKFYIRLRYNFKMLVFFIGFYVIINILIFSQIKENKKRLAISDKQFLKLKKMIIFLVNASLLQYRKDFKI